MSLTSCPIRSYQYRDILAVRIHKPDGVSSAERKRREIEVFLSQGVDAVPSDVVLRVVHPCTVVDVWQREKRLFLLGVVTVSVVGDRCRGIAPSEPEGIEVVPFDHLPVVIDNDTHASQMVRDVIPGFDTAGSSEKPSAVEGRAFELKRPVLHAIYQRTQIIESVSVGIGKETESRYPLALRSYFSRLSLDVAGIFGRLFHGRQRII